MIKTSLFAAAALLALLVSGCAGISTENIPVVENFNPGRYLGTWHEIARLPQSFEEGMTRASATYSWTGGGRIRVTNRGYNPATNRWKTAEGTAEIKGESTRGELLVCFFWPFRSSYRIIVLDPDYRYAAVCGDTLDSLWLLSRRTPLDPAVRAELVEQVAELGFPVENLIFTEGNEPAGATLPQESEN